MHIRCGLLLPMFHGLCLCVGHNCELYTISETNGDVVWCMDLGGTKEPWCTDPPGEGAIY